MKVDVKDYVTKLTAALKKEFGERLLYVGLQGSYLRKEAGDASDIDIMAVLDALEPEDMDAYRRVVKGLEHADRSCGFLCGRRELAEWNRCEICHLLHTTMDCFGRLKELVPEYTQDDVLRYIRLMTGNLYHELCHSRVHGFAPEAAPGDGTPERKAPAKLRKEGSPERTDWERLLPGAFKQAFFILQNKQYLESGVFAIRRAELLPLLSGTDRRVLQEEGLASGSAPEAQETAGAKKRLSAEGRFALLFDWCRETLDWAEKAEPGKRG